MPRLALLRNIAMRVYADDAKFMLTTQKSTGDRISTQSALTGTP